MTSGNEQRRKRRSDSFRRDEADEADNWLAGLRGSGPDPFSAPPPAESFDEPGAGRRSYPDDSPSGSFEAPRGDSPSGSFRAPRVPRDDAPSGSFRAPRVPRDDSPSGSFRAPRVPRDDSPSGSLRAPRDDAPSGSFRAPRVPRDDSPSGTFRPPPAPRGDGFERPPLDPRVSPDATQIGGRRRGRDDSPSGVFRPVSGAPVLQPPAAPEPRGGRRRARSDEPAGGGRATPSESYEHGPNLEPIIKPLADYTPREAATEPPPLVPIFPTMRPDSSPTSSGSLGRRSRRPAEPDFPDGPRAGLDTSAGLDLGPSRRARADSPDVTGSRRPPEARRTADDTGTARRGRGGFEPVGPEPAGFDTGVGRQRSPRGGFYTGEPVDDTTGFRRGARPEETTGFRRDETSGLRRDDTGPLRRDDTGGLRRGDTGGFRDDTGGLRRGETGGFGGDIGGLRGETGGLRGETGGLRGDAAGFRGEEPAAFRRGGPADETTGFRRGAAGPDTTASRRLRDDTGTPRGPGPARSAGFEMTSGGSRRYPPLDEAPQQRRALDDALPGGTGYDELPLRYDDVPPRARRRGTGEYTGEYTTGGTQRALRETTRPGNRPEVRTRPGSPHAPVIDPVRPEHRPHRWVTALIVIGVVVVLGACGLGSWFIFKDEKNGPDSARASATSGPKKRDISSRQVDPNPLTEAEVFPQNNIVAVPNEPPYVILKTQASPDCKIAATDDLVGLLTTAKCTEVVRATMKSPNEEYLVTAGIFDLDSEQAAAKAFDGVKPVVDGQKGRFSGMSVGAGTGTDAIVRAPTQLGWNYRGHFIAYCVIARVDGKDFAPDDPYPNQITFDIVETYLENGIIGARAIVQPEATPAASLPAAPAS